MAAAEQTRGGGRVVQAPHDLGVDVLVWRRNLEVSHAFPKLQDLPATDRRGVRERLVVARSRYLLGESSPDIRGFFQAGDEIARRLYRV